MQVMVTSAPGYPSHPRIWNKVLLWVLVKPLMDEGGVSECPAYRNVIYRLIID